MSNTMYALTVGIELIRIHSGNFLRLKPRVVINYVDSWNPSLGFIEGDDGFEDLCHLWVKRACRHAEWSELNDMLVSQEMVCRTGNILLKGLKK